MSAGARLLLPHRQSMPMQWTTTSMCHNQDQLHADFVYLVLREALPRCDVLLHDLILWKLETAAAKLAVCELHLGQVSRALGADPGCHPSDPSALS